MKLVTLLLGAVFGFAITSVRASEYDMIHGMFVGRDLTVAWVMITAIMVGILGMRLLRAGGLRTITGDPVKISTKPLGRLSPLGAAIFGAGWGLSGACPGTVLAQLGSGKLMALFTLAGMILGTYTYALLRERAGGG